MSGERGGKHVLLYSKNGFVGTGVTVPGTDTIDIAGHALRVNDVVNFSTVPGGSGLVTDTDYYVVEVVDTDNFKLSATKGGAAIDITGTAGAVETQSAWQLFGGLRSKSVTINAEEIDVTNHDSDEWKTLLNTAGIRSAAISGECVWIEADIVIKKIRSEMMLNNFVPLKVELSPDDLSHTVSAMFKVTEFGVSGDYNAEATGTISATSSGVVTYGLPVV